MLVAVITGPNFPSIERQIKKVYKIADLIELRFDLFDKIDLTFIQKILNKYPIKTIFTLRRKDQGGQYNRCEKKRLQKIEELIALSPDYFDLEYDIEEAFLEKISKIYPDVKLISSFHDFSKTAKNLDLLYKKMKKRFFSLYKIAVFLKSSLDGLKLLNFSKDKEDLAVVGLGELGGFTRVLGAVLNSWLTYASVEKPLVEGQIDIFELINNYNFKKLNTTTKIFALIGNPISQSISHIFHNDLFKKNNQNAVYVKIQIEKKELKKFFELIRDLPFKGLSVTMPLKEEISSYVDEDFSKIGAINTISFTKDKILGYNTDGIAALNSIEKKGAVKNKKMIIIGAGGAASAIAYEAIKRGADLIILNRSKNRAFKLAKLFGCRGGSIDKMKDLAKDGYDILVNATSCSRNNVLPLEKKYIRSDALLMDVVRSPKNSIFLKLATADKRVYGEEMFRLQGIMQNRDVFSS